MTRESRSRPRRWGTAIGSRPWSGCTLKCTPVNWGFEAEDLERVLGRPSETCSPAHKPSADCTVAAGGPMAEERAEATGQCLVCKKTFGFDPTEVTTVLIDPETGLPPGFSVLGTMRPAKPESVGRSSDQPICPECVDKYTRLIDGMGSQPFGWGGPPSKN